MAVRPVANRRELERFIRLPWRIYARDPAWVPPLLLDVRTALDRDKHPFHEHAEVEYFLAWQGTEPVGRIAAIVNRAHNEFHEDRVGFFGFFESIDDPAVAAGLLAEAEDWLRQRGMVSVRGPMNFSTNEELSSPGIQLDGFDRPPVIMMTHNPPYYAGLLEATGYGKAMDLLAYWVADNRLQPRLVEALQRLGAAQGVRVRPLEMKHLDEEVARIQDVYNSAWERNWGFVPLTQAEIDHMAKQLKPAIDPNLCLLAESGDEAVGFVLALPDYNQALRHMNGRLLPLGIFKLLWYRRSVTVARTITLGLKPAHRKRGLDAALVAQLFVNGARRGLQHSECSWILEDNVPMRRVLERLGAEVYKTYRVYEKPLAT